MKYKLIVAALAASVLFSCTDRIVPNIEKSVNPAGRAVFTATTEGQSTKTMLEQDGDQYNVIWQSGDEITIVDAASTPNVGVYYTTSTTTNGEFTYASGSEAATPPYKAWYPSAIYNGGAPELPAIQRYFADNIAEAPMYAESNTHSLGFKNLGGILRLKLSTTAEGRKVRRIVLSADQGMSGAISNVSSLASDDFAATVSGTAGVTLDCGESGVAVGTEVTLFHIAVPANAYTGLTITVETTDGIKQTRSLKTGRSIAVGRSSITDVTIAMNGLDGSSYTDLSAEETANTYIVSAAGAYRFKATVKGNGRLDPVTGTTATPITGISGVTVLWEIGGTPGKAIKYSGSAYDIFTDGNYVYFQTPDVFTPGDAYVAVFKDGAGGRAGVYDKDIDEILWSWLIWATPTPGTVNHNNSTFMNRNLGETSLNGWRGFLYQWGRKDPFSPAYDHSHSYTFTPAVSESFNTVTGIQTIDYCIKHPTTHVNNGDANSWMSQAEYALQPWRDGTKTIYDPCPPGWRVPTADQQRGLSGLPTTGFSNSINSFGNPSDGYYRSSTISAYPKAYAFRQSGEQNEWGTNPAFAIRPVRDEAVYNIDDYTDLSATGTANSYIVPARGNYKFRATVKGNGAASLAGVNKDTDPSSIYSAGLVWASYGTASAPAVNELIQRVGYLDGYLYFSTGDTFIEGNAVVAIKDGTGNILWSWHLWFERDNLESKKQTYPGGAVFMDRNLGALSNAYNEYNTLDFGLLYQWGRKDPFLNVVKRGSGFISSDNFTTYYLPAVLGQRETGPGIMTVYHSVSSYVGVPYAIYYAYGSGSTDYNSWASDMSDDLWAENKTIFDPCPPGWKVPSKSAWDATFMNWFNSAWFPIESNFYTGITLDGSIWYPSTGYRMTQPFYYNGVQYSRGQVAAEYNSGYHLRVWAVDGILRKEIFANEPPVSGVFGYNTFGSGNVYRTNGNSVRCVKE